MSRRLVNLTLDTLEDLPHPCRECVFWELDPVAAKDACAAGDPGLEKEAWVSRTLLEWGSCGKLIYVDGVAAGYVMYAPPSYLPGAAGFPTAPPSADAALMTTARVLPRYAGGGLGRMLIQAAARDLSKRGIRAMEAFGDARYGEPDPVRQEVGRCVAPADFFLAVGFKTVRPHTRYPRLRLELRTALSWKSDVEYALDRLLGTMTPHQLGAGARTAVHVAARPRRHAPQWGAGTWWRSVDTSMEPVGTSASTG
jgi:ribosomal protein S18 acetylase RimI-like enzyme